MSKTNPNFLRICQKLFFLMAVLSNFLIQASYGATKKCLEAVHGPIKIYLGSKLGYGEATTRQDYVVDFDKPKVNININLNAKQSDTPFIRLENKGGLIGNTFQSPKRAREETEHFRRVRDPQYLDEIHPARSLLQKLTTVLLPLLEGYLQTEQAKKIEPPYRLHLEKILSALYYQIPTIEFRSDDEEIFKQLPQDRIAATSINQPGAPIVFNSSLFDWGEYKLLDLRKFDFGETMMGNLLNQDIRQFPNPYSLELIANDTTIMGQTNKEAIVRWLCLLVHEMAHQVGLTDDGALTPDLLSNLLQEFFDKQIIVHRLELKNGSHPWAKIIQIDTGSSTLPQMLLAFDLNGVFDLSPAVSNWVKQVFPNLDVNRTWLTDLHIEANSSWDIFHLASAMILKGKLMIEKKNSDSPAALSLLRREVELLLFYGAENKVAEPTFHTSTWLEQGKNPELIYGPEKESLVQLRLLPLKNETFKDSKIILHSPWPNLSIKPDDTWQVMLETTDLPKELIPVSALFNIRPKELRHSAWFRDEEPIQVVGHWESIGGKHLLHFTYKPTTSIKPGTYYIESIRGEFKTKDSNKAVNLDLKTSDRISITVLDPNLNSNTANSENSSSSVSSTNDPLELKRFGVMMVKVIDRKDEIRWMSVTANINLTWTPQGIPNPKTEIIAGWVPVPFVFNRPFNPKHLWLHGHVILKDSHGKNFSMLFSGPLEQLPMVAKFNRVYQNKDNETVLELNIHRPLKVNNFEFVKWFFSGMTVVEDNFDVSYQRLHMYFGNAEKEKK